MSTNEPECAEHERRGDIVLIILQAARFEEGATLLSVAQLREHANLVCGWKKSDWAQISKSQAPD